MDTNLSLNYSGSLSQSLKAFQKQEKFSGLQNLVPLREVTNHSNHSILPEIRHEINNFANNQKNTSHFSLFAKENKNQTVQEINPFQDALKLFNQKSKGIEFTPLANQNDIQLDNFNQIKKNFAFKTSIFEQNQEVSHLKRKDNCLSEIFQIKPLKKRLTNNSTIKFESKKKLYCFECYQEDIFKFPLDCQNLNPKVITKDDDVETDDELLKKSIVQGYSILVQGVVDKHGDAKDKLTEEYQNPKYYLRWN